MKKRGPNMSTSCSCGSSPRKTANKREARPNASDGQAGSRFTRSLGRVPGLCKFPRIGILQWGKGPQDSTLGRKPMQQVLFEIPVKTIAGWFPSAPLFVYIALAVFAGGAGIYFERRRQEAGWQTKINFRIAGIVLA